MSTKSLDTIKRELQVSPLFNLSLTNKELFHSNFLAWFGNTYKTEFKQLIEELLEDKLGPGCWPSDILDYKIDREYMHFDICVKDSHNKPRIVIENKVKSVPTQGQLDRYRNDVGSNNNSCLFILLTMTKLSSAEGWNNITYKDISDKLSHIKVHDSYHSQLIADYRAYVENLQDVIEFFDSETSYYSSDYELMNQLGIHDICGKRKAQRLHQKLLGECKSKGWSVALEQLKWKEENFFAGWGFTNSQPLIEMKMRVNQDVIIIQVQGKQYRHAVEFFEPMNGDRIVKVDKEFFPSQKGLEYLLASHPDMYAAPGLDPLNYPFSGKFGHNKKQGFCKYCNGKPDANGRISCFVYQWIPIPPKMTCDELVSNIIKDIEAIKNRHRLK